MLEIFSGMTILRFFYCVHYSKNACIMIDTCFDNACIGVANAKNVRIRFVYPKVTYNASIYVKNICVWLVGTKNIDVKIAKNADSKSA